ncbi:unnamed protein product, partial [Meganyctiphanes norvegica]
MESDGWLSTDEEAALMYILHTRQRKRRRRKRYWVHPLNAARIDVGQYHTIMNELKADGDKFFNYFRMSHNSFKELLELLEPHIKKKDTNMRRSIAPEERLAITLRYLATGCSFRDLHYSFRIGHNTAYGIVFDVCDKIWRHLHERLIPVLTQQDWLNIAEDFKIRNNFLNCLGAIDGKHIRLIKPYGTG